MSFAPGYLLSPSAPAFPLESSLEKIPKIGVLSLEAPRSWAQCIRAGWFEAFFLGFKKAIVEVSLFLATIFGNSFFRKEAF